MLLDNIEKPTFIPRLLFIIHPELPGASRRVTSKRRRRRRHVPTRPKQ